MTMDKRLCMVGYIDESEMTFCEFELGEIEKVNNDTFRVGEVTVESYDFENTEFNLLVDPSAIDITELVEALEPKVFLDNIPPYLIAKYLEDTTDCVVLRGEERPNFAKEMIKANGLTESIHALIKEVYDVA